MEGPDMVVVIDSQRLRGDATAAALTRLGVPSATSDASAAADVALLCEHAAESDEAERVLADNGCKVLLLVDHAEPRAALAGRCFGVLSGRTEVQGLARAVMEARSGRAPRPWRPAAPSTETQRAKALVNTLSPRERTILELLATARRNDEIGVELDISANTVRTHVQNILGKLGVGNRVAAVSLARKAGLQLVGPVRGVGDGAA
jgi:DNA-binding NarL/FixJ family response regulator